MQELVDPLASVRRYLDAEKSTSTRRAYSSDWADFSAWCDAASEPSMPATPIAVARYLAQLADAGRKVATIERRVAAIRSLHKAAGHEPPTNAEGVKAVMRGIRRSVRSAPRRKAPATAEVLSKALDLLSSEPSGLRDRAILLVGFAGALRRSELVALQVEDAAIDADGMLVQIRASKTDQEGNGVQLAIPRGRRHCPVAALEAWLKASTITTGPIFREVDRHGRIGAQQLSDRSVARIVKRSARAAGLDERDFSGHSLRAGFVTTALEKSVDALRIMKTTRHAKVDTLRIYDRRRRDFDNAAGKELL